MSELILSIADTFNNLTNHEKNSVHASLKEYFGKPIHFSVNDLSSLTNEEIEIVNSTLNGVILTKQNLPKFLDPQKKELRLMDTAVQQSLDAALRNWNAMSKADGEDAEGTAEAFEASFYRFIDAVRDWVASLEPRPQTLEELLELPTAAELVDRLPVPLYLNFETEAELILENKLRIEEDKYD